MANASPASPEPNGRVVESRLRERVVDEHVPLPTSHFRRRAWLEFQRALDPLAPPRPLRPTRH